MSGLGLKAKIFRLGHETRILGRADRDLGLALLGLGLAPCGLVSITVVLHHPPVL